jgi:hypothetical protein
MKSISITKDIVNDNNVNNSSVNIDNIDKTNKKIGKNNPKTDKFGSKFNNKTFRSIFDAFNES